MEKSLYSERGKSIAFTGHRIIPLVRQEEVKARLTAAVAFACEMGITRFYCGMALGLRVVAQRQVPQYTVDCRCPVFGTERPMGFL